MLLATTQWLSRPSRVSVPASRALVHQKLPQAPRLTRSAARPAPRKRPAFTHLCRAQYDDRQWPRTTPDAGDSYLANPQQAGNGVFVLLLINLLIFLADKVMHLPIVQSLYLYHAAPQWFQVHTIFL